MQKAFGAAAYHGTPCTPEHGARFTAGALNLFRAPRVWTSERAPGAREGGPTMFPAYVDPILPTLAFGPVPGLAAAALLAVTAVLAVVILVARDRGSSTRVERRPLGPEP